MAIQIDKRFTIRAPVNDVWALLIDPYRVAECLPGSSITGKDGYTYTGIMKVRLGPVSSSYNGTVRFEHMDPETHTAQLSAEGRDTRGKGAADMTMKSVLSRAGHGTEVHVVSEVNVTGVLAQLGRGMVEDVADQLFDQFTTCMRAKLETSVLPDDSPAPTGIASPRPASGGAPAEPEAAIRRSTPQTAPSRSQSQDALDLGAVGTQAAARAGGRMLRRPGFWIAVAILAVLAWTVIR